MTYPHIDPDYDAEAIYQADRKRKAGEVVDSAIFAYATLSKFEPAQCQECMLKVREVLKAYEHP